MGKLRKLALDVLKPHQPSIIDVANYLSDLDGVESVDIVLIEMDINVESVKIVLQGRELNFEEIEKIINENGGTIHSIDEVSCGKKAIKDTD
jgi:hypothetical protein